MLCSITAHDLSALSPFLLCQFEIIRQRLGKVLFQALYAELTGIQGVSTNFRINLQLKPCDRRRSYYARFRPWTVKDLPTSFGIR